MKKTIANLQSVISTVAPPWDPAFARTSWERERFHKIIIGFNRWMSVWGGVDNWNSGLLAAYEEVVEMGEQEVEHFYGMVWSHANCGRVLQVQPGEMQGNLPPEHHRVKELYYLEVWAMIALTKGITIIEIRVPLLSNYLSIHNQVEQQRGLEMAQLPPSDPPSDSEDSLSEHS
ncbi:hypothetical protein AN958_04072 [Leucoagaricus sp. SymC.cos]|nr:hypothetical protein AN958_04072 [Leucoagaricus sp. SymC.cos]